MGETSMQAHLRSEQLLDRQARGRGRGTLQRWRTRDSSSARPRRPLGGLDPPGNIWREEDVVVEA